MAAESPFVLTALEVARESFTEQFSVVRGASLLYELKVSNTLEIMNAEQIKRPKRGVSAFETDLCLFERKTPDVAIPRVVVEFKTTITSHDVLTYSAKAMRHKRIYPYLRYGMVASGEDRVPGRAFTHNESLDFFAGVRGQSPQEFRAFFADLLHKEVAASELLEEIAYGKVCTRLYRNGPIVYAG